MSQTLLDLKEDVLSYLHRNLNLQNSFQGTADDVKMDAILDRLVLRGANNARKRAEKLHDWCGQWGSQLVTLTENKANWSALFSSIKIACLKNDSSTTDYISEEVDLYLENTKAYNMRKRSREMNTGCDPKLGRETVIKDGNYVRPMFEVPSGYSLCLKGYTWMSDYITDAAYENLIDAAVKVTDTSIKLTMDDDWGNFGVVVGSFLYVTGITELPESFYLVESLSSSNPTITVPATVTTVTAVNAKVTFVRVDYTDGFLDDNYEFMMWATICEVNHLIKVYVPRQEGSLPPPTKERDQALSEAIRFDIDKSTQI